MARPPLELVLLDAGNTLVFLDHEAVADIVVSHGGTTHEGAAIDARTLCRAEGEAKRRYETRLRAGVSHEEGWGLYLRTLLEEGGMSASEAARMVAPLRRAHDAFNLWRRVPADLKPALRALEARGLRLGVVSNSEGKLGELFARVGLDGCFECIVDSHFEGVRKPDPEIFRRALSKLGVAADKAIYLGDIPGIDIDGARAAGMDAVLIDALGFYPDHETSARHPSVAAWAASL